MCAYSLILDQARKVSLDKWSLTSYNYLREALESVKQLDIVLGLKDCEDPEKVEWFNSLEETILYGRDRRSNQNDQ